MKEKRTARFWFRREKIKPGLYLYKCTDHLQRRTFKTFNKDIFMSMKVTLLKCERERRKQLRQVFSVAA